MSILTFELKFNQNKRQPLSTGQVKVELNIQIRCIRHNTPRCSENFKWEDMYK